jgi:ribosome-binding ATPase YchF (GTP1/OBG family)
MIIFPVMVSLGSKEKGKLRLEGKEYLVRDGDVIPL